ncbi:MAG TPA: cysteine desulfurase, partial [Candidatus Tenderia electrophaga]|nr:cysteine desulfurase [Candidatus Tenderia electrophaga]
MMPYLRAHHGNPSSVHRQGRLARQAIETARQQVAQLVNAHPSQVVFTGGGTEANNLALKGALVSPRCVAVSAVEHASVLAPLQQMAMEGGQLVRIDVDKDGLITEEAMSIALESAPEMVSIMLANNETGVIQDVARWAEMAAVAGALLHTDAVQAVGKMNVDFAGLGVQLMSLSSHKLYGPKGVGALVRDQRIELAAQMVGGGQETGYRSGTENVAAIVGFGKAAELAGLELQSRCSDMLALKRKLLQRLSKIEGVVVFADQAECLPNTVFLAVPGIDGETLLMQMDRAGIAVSSGSACDSRKSGASQTLLAMGVDEGLARCAVRVSIGKDNTEQDIDVFISAMVQQIKVVRESSMLAWA